MLSLNEIVLYGAVIGWGVYCILIVPYFGSKILMKSGESERFWFFILVLLNLWALLFIIFRPSFRKGLSTSDLKALIIFACGYIIFFPMLIWVIETI